MEELVLADALTSCRGKFTKRINYVQIFGLFEIPTWMPFEDSGDDALFPDPPPAPPPPPPPPFC